MTIVLDSIIPFITKNIIDVALPSRSPAKVALFIGLLVLVTGSKAFFGYTKEYQFDYIGIKIFEDIKVTFFNHIQTLHFKYFDNINTGELMSRLGEDLENIWRSFAFGFRLVVEEGLYFIIGIIILSAINFKMTVIVLLVLLPVLFLAISFEKKIDKNFEEISDQTAELNTTAQENIAGVRLVKAFAREKHEIEKFFKKNQGNFELNNEGARIIGNHFPFIELLTNLSVIFMIFLGGYNVMNGKMTIGQLAMYSNLIWNLIWPLREIGWLMNMWAQFNASRKKVMEIFETDALIKDEEGLMDHKLSLIHI